MRVTSFLLMFAGVLATMGCNKSSTEKGDPPAAKPGDSSAQGITEAKAEAVTDGVMVYYFHGNRRCPTCLGIQAGIEQVIRERFDAEVTAKTLAFQDVNIDEDANKPFVEQFQISFGTMIVARVQGGKTLAWENCDKVWEYAHDAPKLMDYAAERIRAHLAKAEAK
jgi:hypothetical protein